MTVSWQRHSLIERSRAGLAWPCLADGSGVQAAELNGSRLLAPNLRGLSLGLRMQFVPFVKRNASVCHHLIAHQASIKEGNLALAVGRHVEVMRDQYNRQSLLVQLL